MQFHRHKVYYEHHEHTRKKRLTIIAWFLGAIAIILGISVVYILTHSNAASGGSTISIDQARAIVSNNVRNLAQTQDVNIVSIRDAGTVYAVNLTVAGQSYLSYLTKDGRLLFPSGIMLSGVEISGPSYVQTSAVVPKTDKPVVELFSMAYSPYLLQMEKGLLPVLISLDRNVDFKLRFVYFSMYGEREIWEEVNQYCIQKNEPQKLLSYLNCFVESGDGASCLRDANISTSELNSCIVQTNSTYNVADNFNDKSRWVNITNVGLVSQFTADLAYNQKYNIGGSPMIFVNGVFVDTQKTRDSEDLLKLICQGYASPPAACSQILSSVTPQPGFVNQQAANQAVSAEPKSDVPRIQLFVMSYCPYGTQAEKGILPAVRALGDKINFTIDFVDYSMHESFAPEVEENLRQYCIEKNQPAVYLKYLACFLNASNPQGLDTNTTACQQEAGVDVAAMNSCYASTDAQYNITSMMANKSTWVSGQFPQFNIEKNQNVQFGVQGSPTLVINGVQSNAGRDSASYLSAICDAFYTQPSECNTNLSSTSPGPGFGYSSTSEATSAGCGV